MEDRISLFVVTCNDVALCYSKTEQEAINFAKEKLEELKQEIEEDDHRIFSEEKEGEWSISTQKLGYLWDGIVVLYAKIKVQIVHPICYSV